MMLSRRVETMPAEPIVSRPYRPGENCCERCVFGSGEHAVWCEEFGPWAKIDLAKIQNDSVSIVRIMNHADNKT